MLPALFVLALASQTHAELAPVFHPQADVSFDVDHDGGEVDDAGVRKKKIKRKPVRRTPPPVAARPRKEASPVSVGLAGAAGAAIGAAVGLGGITAAGLYTTQVIGPQPPEVILATAVIAIGIAVATPFMAGLGGGAGVLLADPRSKPDEWSGLLQCAASGYCAGVGAVAGSLFGCGVPGTNGNCLQFPGPDRPAEWTAGASIAGLVGGSLVGIVGGYLLAPDKLDPYIPMAIGTLGGALLGSATVGGLAAGVATGLRP